MPSGTPNLLFSLTVLVPVTQILEQQTPFNTKVLGEAIERREHRKWRHPAHGAQGAMRHQIAQVAQQMDILLTILAGDDFVDGFNAVMLENPNPVCSSSAARQRRHLLSAIKVTHRSP